MSKLSLSAVSLDITVFVCGAVVMIFEITGSRVLSPFLGASTYVWTSLIGVILGSLSLGYYLGGRLADKWPDVKILAGAIFIAAGFISLTVLSKELVLAGIETAPVGIELRSVLASLILFAPASVCLGFVTPYCVRLKMASVEDSGRTVGRLYALSTVGSIFGTFAAGFFLIPFVGSIRTLYALSLVLILLSIFLVPFTISRLSIGVLTVFVLSMVANEAGTLLLLDQNGLHDIDTEYSRVQVFNAADPKTGRPIRALATDPYFTQSAMFLDGDEPVFDYSRYYHLVRHVKPEFEKVLVIGGAGYSSAKIDVVEIDEGMTEIAREYFDLVDDARINIFHEDARTYLRRTRSGEYDAIMMDAFGSLFSVPYQLTTIEAVREIRRNLRDDGVVIFNLGSAITGEASHFLQAEMATYRAAFPQVYLFKVKSEYADDRLQNLIIVASASSM
ncbi:MAG: fused MFS/spermidine synthase, partial [Blastocatellia bacterium]|nr:fused MFS/spermidine synthase [Blastocatellia bacterium]